MQLSFHQRLKLRIQLFVLKLKNDWSWDHIRRVTHSVFNDADSSTIRLLLANASLVWAAIVWFNPAVFERPSYDIMRAVAGHEVWSVAFLLHFLGVYWRTYDPVPRVVQGLIINGYGFMIWFFTTMSLNYYVGSPSPGTSAEFVLCLASAWALYKTGFNRELISP
jgi:hypothetical protein